MDTLVLYLLAICAFVSVVCTQEDDDLRLVPPYTCTTTTKTTMCTPDSASGSVSSPRVPVSKIQQGRPGKIGPVGQKGERGEKGDPCHCDIADEEEVRRLRSEWTEMKSKFEELKENNGVLENEVRNLTRPVIDCSEYREKLSRLGRSFSKRTIDTVLNGEITRVNCIAEESNTWTVIQRRMDGSVDFYRGWEDYKNGFGNPDEEYWLGLESLYKMTSRKSYSLRIDLLNWENERRYATYSTFRIGNEASNYRLTVSGYSGDANDGMNYHNGRPFTTLDRDNDLSGSNCAHTHHGAWWYKSCYYANLNGKYYERSSGPGGNGVSWQKWDGDNYSLKFVEMKIQPN